MIGSVLAVTIVKSVNYVINHHEWSSRKREKTCKKMARTTYKTLMIAVVILYFFSLFVQFNFFGPGFGAAIIYAVGGVAFGTILKSGIGK